MTRIIALALAATLVLPAGAAIAKEKGGRHCPPGLAKKDPACVPPGQAKKGLRYDEDYAREDRYKDDDDRYEHEDDDDWYGDRYDRLETGDRVVMDGREYEVIRIGDRIILRREDDAYRLPRIGDGSEYVRMGDVIVRVDRKTKAAIQIIELADLILG